MAKRIDQTTLMNNHDRILRWIQTQGIIFCEGENEIARAKEATLPLLPVFPSEFLALSAIFVYRQCEQPEPLCNDDASLWVDVTMDGCGTLYALGISVEAMNRGEEYATLCIIHELTHLYHREHSRAFHDHLNEFLQRYNQRMGKNLVNDFSGLPMRFDSMDYDPFSREIPRMQRSVSGTAFREG